MDQKFDKLKDYRTPIGECRELIVQATDEELDAIILLVVSSPDRYNVALAERQRRQFTKQQKTHWTTTPGFWISVISLLLAVAGYFSCRTSPPATPPLHPAADKSPAGVSNSTAPAVEK